MPNSFFIRHKACLSATLLVAGLTAWILAALPSLAVAQGHRSHHHAQKLAPNMPSNSARVVYKDDWSEILVLRKRQHLVVTTTQRRCPVRVGERVKLSVPFSQIGRNQSLQTRRGACVIEDAKAINGVGLAQEVDLSRVVVKAFDRLFVGDVFGGCFGLTRIEPRAVFIQSSFFGEPETLLVRRVTGRLDECRLWGVRRLR